MRRTIASLILLMTVVFLGACISAPNMQMMETKVVTDGIGRQVQVSNNLHRIASLGGSNDDLLLSLVSPERIVAISSAPQNLVEKGEKIKRKIHMNIESIISVQPDLLILAEWMPIDFIEQLSYSEIPVYVVKTPKSIAELKENIIRLGEVLNAENEAAIILAEIDADLALMDETWQKQGTDIKKTVVSYSTHGAIGGMDTLFDDLCRSAHVNNGAAMAGLKGINSLSKEVLVQISPDIIILEGGEYNNDNYQALLVADLLSDPSLATLSAVKQGQICVIDARLLLTLSHFAVKAAVEINSYAYGKVIREENIAI